MSDNNKFVIPAGTLAGLQELMRAGADSDIDVESAMDRLVDEYEDPDVTAARAAAEHERRKALLEEAKKTSSFSDNHGEDDDSLYDEEDDENEDSPADENDHSGWNFFEDDDDPTGMSGGTGTPASFAGDTVSPAVPGPDIPEPEEPEPADEVDDDPQDLPEDAPEVSALGDLPCGPEPGTGDETVYRPAPGVDTADPAGEYGADTDGADTDSVQEDLSADEDLPFDADVPWRMPAAPPVPTPDDVGTLSPAAAPVDESAGDDSDGDDTGKSSSKKTKKSFGGLIRSAHGVVDRFPILKPIAGIAAALAVVGIATSNIGDSPSTTKAIPSATVPTVDQEIPAGDAKPEPRLLKPSGFGPPNRRCAPRSTDVRQAFTDDNRNVWKCRRVMGITHTVFEIDFDQPMVITDIHVVPGWDYVEPNGLDHWNEQRIVTLIHWRIGQARPIPQTFDPAIRTGSVLHIPNIATQKIVGTVDQDVEPPAVGNPDGGAPSGLGRDVNIDDYFAIGRIEVYGYPAGNR